MPKITAWKCSWDGKVFERYCDYRKHLKNLARVRAAARKDQRIRNGLDRFILDMRTTVKTPTELLDFIRANSDKFIKRSIYRNEWRWSGRTPPKAKITKVNFEHLNWNDEVSNSHRAPFGQIE